MKARATNMPGSLPMLPGNVYADPTVTRYHKTQLLGVKDNTICGKYDESNAAHCVEVEKFKQ